MIRPAEVRLVAAGDAHESTSGRHVHQGNGGVEKGRKDPPFGGLIIVGRIAEPSLEAAVEGISSESFVLRVIEVESNWGWFPVSASTTRMISRLRTSRWKTSSP